MKTVRNELDEREQELVSYLIKDCKTTGDTDKTETAVCWND